MSAQPPVAQQNRGIIGRARSAPRLTDRKNLERQEGTPGDRLPCGRRYARIANLALYLSAPVLQACSVPPRLRDSLPIPASGLDLIVPVIGQTQGRTHVACCRESGSVVDDNTTAPDSPVDRRSGPKLAHISQVVDPVADTVSMQVLAGSTTPLERPPVTARAIAREPT